VTQDAPRRVGRFPLVLAGLLSSGCLVLGGLMLVLQFVAPATGGSGQFVANGPGWGPTLIVLAVGIAGEGGRRISRDQPAAERLLLASGVIAAALLALGITWWR
jgi:hypothetical protein